MNTLRQVFADFARLEERSGLGLSVPLGREDLSPELAELREGERVLLIEPDNLSAEGTVRSVESGGHRYWFGLLERMAAIQHLDASAPATHAQPAGQ